MSHYIKVSVALNEEQEENCISIFRSIMHSHNMLLNIGASIANEFDLHIAEINVIDMLGKHGPLPMGGLASTTFVSPSTTTRTVKKLEERGLVKRERSNESERVVTVFLTDKGKSLFKKCYPKILLAVQQRFEDVLTPPERKTLARLLKKLAP